MSHAVCCDTRGKGPPLLRVSQQTVCDIRSLAVVRMQNTGWPTAPARGEAKSDRPTWGSNPRQFDANQGWMKLMMIRVECSTN
ncbi:hypothetical protein PGT21_025857 [Puccinia graminis f. sp. tritici]|uniref:Uncharacterized protein n=1 Tax=Puccinia graminis f. sp. tritici TaxID=56615 RepID=A0A5B0MSB3_PUCGR|nr:hypothetical protein PGT21_025857 [Puccinia graminis f. sp. tritici]